MVHISLPTSLTALDPHTPIPPLLSPLPTPGPTTPSPPPIPPGLTCTWRNNSSLAGYPLQSLKSWRPASTHIYTHTHTTWTCHNTPIHTIQSWDRCLLHIKALLSLPQMTHSHRTQTVEFSTPPPPPLSSLATHSSWCVRGVRHAQTRIPADSNSFCIVDGLYE